MNCSKRRDDFNICKEDRNAKNTKMVNLDNFTKANLTYIKPSEVKVSPDSVFVITSEPTLVESEFKGVKTIKLHTEGEWNKEKRSLDLSKTNARTVSKALGNETKTWIGHQLFLEVYKTKGSDGQLYDAINVKEAK